MYCNGWIKRVHRQVPTPLFNSRQSRPSLPPLNNRRGASPILHYNMPLVYAKNYRTSRKNNAESARLLYVSSKWARSVFRELHLTFLTIQYEKQGWRNGATFCERLHALCGARDLHLWEAQKPGLRDQMVQVRSCRKQHTLQTRYQGRGKGVGHYQEIQQGWHHQSAYSAEYSWCVGVWHRSRLSSW